MLNNRKDEIQKVPISILTFVWIGVVTGRAGMVVLVTGLFANLVGLVKLVDPTESVIAVWGADTRAGWVESGN